MEQTITEFFTAVERQVQSLEYGTLTGTVLIQDGLPVIKTLNIVLSKRKRYKISPEIDKNRD
jgi:hypothetical protein